jgi:CspA family cold shock protein
MSVELEVSNESTEERITGRVKWFNNKAGFGFVTAVDGELKDKDVFVHYSSINVPEDQYKYLVQGEYVDFELTNSEKSEHEFHAVNISGVKGGNLMCETRRHSLESRPYKPRVYKTPDERVANSSTTKDVSEATPRKKYSSSKTGPSINKDDDGYTKIPVRRSKTSK